LPWGWIAGLFYAFACAVMLGLGQSDDLTFVTAMQEINDAIQNPAFLLSFLGAPVLTAVAAALEWRRGSRAAFGWVVAALVLYLVALGVMFGANIPLNDELADAGDPDRIVDLAAVRE
jgi:uncharacterized membrane protein